MKRIFRGTTVRPDAQRDVSDELRFHLEMRTREFVDSGMDGDSARRAALAAFGDVDAIGAELRVERASRGQARERRDRLSELAMDVRFALRTLWKNAAFTAATLATLALGIGATTAVFTVVNGVLLRPLPYAEPSRLEMIWLLFPSRSESEQLPLSAAIYTDARANARSFSDMSAFRAWPYTLSSGGDAEQVAGARVTPSLFGVLGVKPARGRALTDADVLPGAERVAVISDALWQRRFGGAPGVVGTHVELGGEQVTVVGIMPPGFSFPRGAELPAGLQFGARTDLWTPLTFSAKDVRDIGTLNIAVVGRLKPGVTPAAARADLSTQLKRFLAVNAPSVMFAYHMLDLQEQAAQQVRKGLLLLMGAVAFVLFIACANVTNLLVARTSGRRREFAVRAALGAGRSRIARQLITENVLLAALGTALGVLLAAWVTRVMLRLVPGSMPRVDDVGIDWRVMAGVGALAIVVGAAFGLISTVQLRTGELAGALHDAAARSTGSRARRAGRRMLVVAEVSLSLMLVIGAALLALSFVRLQRAQPGFTPGGVLTASVVLPIPNGFNPKRDGPGWGRLFQQLNTRLAASPGVIATGAVSALPLTGTVEGGPLAEVGRPLPGPGQAPQAEYSVVEGDYFRTMGIKLAAGRAFTSADGARSLPVIIVNREFVRRYMRSEPALDKQLYSYFDFSDGAPRTIVGVVDNVQSATLDGAVKPQVYVPEQQMTYPALRIVMRTQGDPLAALPTLKRELRALDPRLAAADVRTMDDVFDESLARQKFSTMIMGVFAAAALLLAVVGLYGVIALSVAQRRREIGVRMALGARPADVLRLVLGEGARITGAGVILGLAGAVMVSRVVAALLFGVSATSAAVYGVATVAIAVVTLFATYLPARRATRVDPTLALRGE